MIALRDYQQAAFDAVQAGWSSCTRQLGVAATGAGKTILFSHLAAAEVGSTLILCHREELIKQAVTKLHAATGIFARIERGNCRAVPGHGVVVASVQTMRRRLAKYAPDSFGLVICDEAHHCLSDEWQVVINHFLKGGARLLGVTATPDRADRKSLGKVFERVAFEIGLLGLINDGHLSPLRSLKLDVEVPLGALSKRRKDVTEEEAAGAVQAQIAALSGAVAGEVWDRKTLVFLPRCDVSEHFAELLNAHGVEARHVAGDSDDRAEVLAWFATPGAKALCNAMLLTEGYDQPDVDCICCLRATKSRALYAQMVGRGTRVAPGKDFCLILDPLWLSGEIDLCKPADLIAPNVEHREALQKRMDEGLTLSDAELLARADVEEAIARRVEEAKKNRKAPKGLVDPLAWAVGIHDSNLQEWEAAMPWEEENATPDQLAALTKLGLWAETVSRGFAELLLARAELRRSLGLASAKQVTLLRRFGFAQADTMTADQAGYAIGQKLKR